MNLDEFSKKPDPDKQLNELSPDTLNSYKKKARSANTDIYNSNGFNGARGSTTKSSRNSYEKAARHEKGIDRANARTNEATGDPKFDSMLGNITGNTEPQTTGGAASDKVAAKSAVPPDDETINALNKMMYDMHVTMQTAERLMQKLIQGR
jgi:hypothetical protein